MPPSDYEPVNMGTFEYFQSNRQRFAVDMKTIIDTIGELTKIAFKETSDKAIYLYSSTEIKKLMTQVRKVEKLYFGEQR